MKLLASVLSGWNYLYSSRGLGDQKPITVNKFVQTCPDKGLILEPVSELCRVNYLERACEAVSEVTSKPIGLRTAIKLNHPGRVEAPKETQLRDMLETLKDNKN